MFFQEIHPVLQEATPTKKQKEKKKLISMKPSDSMAHPALTD